MPKILFTVCRINSDFIPLHNKIKKILTEFKKQTNKQKTASTYAHKCAKASRFILRRFLSLRQNPTLRPAMARCRSGSPAAAAAAEWLRQQVIHPPIPPFYTQPTFAHTSSQVTWFWRVTRPPQWTQQWRPKTERESKPPWRKSLHFPAPRNAAEHTPSFYVQHQPQNLIVSLSLFFFLDWGFCGLFCPQRF